MRELVLIHGWGLNRQVWQEFTPYLQQNWRITLIDLPGYNAKPSVTSDLSRLAAQILTDIPEEATVLAWSLGGLVALRMAQLSQAIVDLVLLASTPCFVKTENWSHGLEAQAIKHLVKRLRIDKNAALKEFISLVAYGDCKPRQTVRLLKTYIADKQPDLETLETGLALLQNIDLREVLAGLAQPVGLLLGSNDILVNRLTGRALKTIRPQLPVIEIADAGHAPFISCPVQTAAALNKLADAARNARKIPD